jgi:hypothetical protein
MLLQHILFLMAVRLFTRLAAVAVMLCMCCWDEVCWWLQCAI